MATDRLSISLVMPTLDRSPRKNFLGVTLENLIRAGVFDSYRLASFHLVDSGSPDTAIYLQSQAVNPDAVEVHLATTRRVARENVAKCLQVGGESQADVVLYCEDDIDVCGNFLESVGRWLEDHLRPEIPLYAFGAAYVQIQHLFEKKKATSWVYDVGAFYGTQCFAVVPTVALEIAYWLRTHKLVCGVDSPGAYDLSIAEWAQSKGVTHFLASVPNFVQHLGDQSALDNKFFAFPAWPGRSWTYASGVVHL